MSGGKDNDPLSLINRLAEEESRLESETFLAPYVRGARVQVRIKGLLYELEVIDDSELDATGCFGLFRLNSPGKAVAVERASRSQISRYLKLLPRLQLIIVDEFDGRWWGLQANTSDSRFSLSEPVPIQLADRCTSFEQVNARFDGRQFWYEGSNRRRNPTIARNLRQALIDDVEPDHLRVSNVVPQELFAYRILWFDKHPELRPVEDSSEGNEDEELVSPEGVEGASFYDPQVQEYYERQYPEEARRRQRDGSSRQSDVDRLRRALRHAGAELDSYWRQNDGSCTVRYVVGGDTFSAQVRMDDLTVISSGICLSGRDGDFDLTSLVGVMREYRVEENW